MRATLSLLLAALGAVAVLIAASIFLLGAEPTAGASERAFELITGWRGAAGERWPPTMDGELRFYAPFWGGYGVMLLATARKLSRHMGRIPWLAGVFFAGGVGRALSFVTLGPPHPVFTLLMTVELLTPPVFILLWLGVRRGGR